MQTQDALLMLLSLYVGWVYGGSLTAIMINIPGPPRIPHGHPENGPRQGTERCRVRVG
ncbi:MAG: hypothetical protein HY713_11545 [candidate division NC10 bacterium]|nr:hypothetical protein [candidate division NC10 bacterium]